MLLLELSAPFRKLFPDACIGLLLMDGVTNAERDARLESALAEVQTSLRQRYASADRSQLNELPVIKAYAAHYKRFGQTYHVLRQLESVALKGRELASPSGTLISAMFAAELSTLLLTAGHDAELLVPPLLLDASHEGDRFVGINGHPRDLKAGDMLMRDAAGIISAVLYGPDLRTRLSDQTRRALFVTYAPGGIAPEAVMQHMHEIARNVKLASPPCEVVQLGVVGPKSYETR